MDFIDSFSGNQAVFPEKLALFSASLLASSAACLVGCCRAESLADLEALGILTGARALRVSRLPL